VAQLARFPGIGERTATRLAYWLLRQPPETAADIGEALIGFRASMKRCSRCCDLSVVERPQDIGAIEASGEYRGRYHVLDGAISPLDGVGPEQLRIPELLSRIEAGGVDELLVATDPDVEGDTTALYLARLCKPLGLRVTRLAHGIAVGTELEYADRSSVARAIENRREM
jgi:recombination protein RecR